MKKALALVIFIAITFNSSAQATNTDNIRKLLEVTGAAKIGLETSKNLINKFKELMPDVPEEFWKKFSDLLQTDDIIKITIPIYQKHFSDSDIEQLLSFYATPVGKKMIEKNPIIYQEANAAGEKWGRAIAEKVIEELEKSGYKID